MDLLTKFYITASCSIDKLTTVYYNSVSQSLLEVLEKQNSKIPILLSKCKEFDLAVVYAGKEDIENILGWRLSILFPNNKFGTKMYISPLAEECGVKHKVEELLVNNLDYANELFKGASDNSLKEENKRILSLIISYVDDMTDADLKRLRKFLEKIVGY